MGGANKRMRMRGMDWRSEWTDRMDGRMGMTRMDGRSEWIDRANGRTRIGLLSQNIWLKKLTPSISSSPSLLAMKKCGVNTGDTVCTDNDEWDRMGRRSGRDWLWTLTQQAESDGIGRDGPNLLCYEDGRRWTLEHRCALATSMTKI